MLGSVRQRVTLVSHVLLVCMVAVAWYYVLLAGKVLTYFYFGKISLSIMILIFSLSGTEHTP